MPGTNPTIGGGGFHHVALKVHNFEAVVKFYQDVLGFKEKISWGQGDSRGILLDTGDGNYVEVFAGGKPGPIPDGVIFHYAIRTTNLDAAVARARAAGAEVTMEPRNLDIPSNPVTPVRIAFIKGAAGESIEFFQNELT
jgi:glyoxylase I family protein